eukprot:gene10557-3076_t
MKQNSFNSTTNQQGNQNGTTPSSKVPIQSEEDKKKSVDQFLKLSSSQQTQNLNSNQGQNSQVYGNFQSSSLERSIQRPNNNAPLQNFSQPSYSKFSQIPTSSSQQVSQNKNQGFQNIPTQNYQQMNKSNMMTQQRPLIQQQHSMVQQNPYMIQQPNVYPIPNKYPYQKSTTYQQQQQVFAKPPTLYQNQQQNHQMYGQNYQQHLMNPSNLQNQFIPKNYNGMSIKSQQHLAPKTNLSNVQHVQRQKTTTPEKKKPKKKLILDYEEEEEHDIFGEEDESEEDFDDPNDGDFETKMNRKPNQNRYLNNEEQDDDDDDDDMSTEDEKEYQFEKKKEKKKDSDDYFGKYSYDDFEPNRNLRTKEKQNYGDLFDESEDSDEQETEEDSDDFDNSDSDIEIRKRKKNSLLENTELIVEEEEEIIETILKHKINEETTLMEFLIKWKGWAHIHNTWNTFEELKLYKGFKKVENYLKKIKEIDEWKKSVTPEEIEQHLVYEELDEQLNEDYKKIDRIIGKRPARHAKNFVNKEEKIEEGFKYEVLVKWKSLPYSDCTWEYEATMNNIKDYIPFEERKGYTYPNISSKRNPLNFKKIEKQPEFLVGGQLRDYQLESLNWMFYSWLNKNNVILADEMGLGKTLQSISLLSYLVNVENILGPFLVVVPLSTISGWMKEIKKWAPDLYVIPYIGDTKSRNVIREYDFYTKDNNFKFNIILTTYELILKDCSFLSQIKYSFLVVDEAHRLKNDQSKLYEILKQFSTAGKLLITGTPLQNSIKELWNLLHFLMPQKYSNFNDFETKYSNLSEENQITKLHENLAPHILRRLKLDVEKSLPKKVERILRIERTQLQKKYYRWILEKNFSELNKGGHKSSLLNIVIELKKVCNHPYLFDGAKDEMKKYTKLQGLIKSSGKMQLLDKLLIKLKDTGHRVLIFSQMVRLLDILSEYLQLRGFTFQRLDGSTSHRSQRAKQKMILDHLIIQRMDTSGRIVLQNNKKQTYTQFSKEELQEVLKFGAENLFKKDKSNLEDQFDQNEDEEDELEINLDDILKRAEETQEKLIGDEKTNDDSENKNIMSSFKVANFTTTTKKKKSKKLKLQEKDDFWEKIIPESILNKKKSEELYLPPRRTTTKIESYNENNLSQNSSGGGGNGSGSGSGFGSGNGSTNDIEKKSTNGIFNIKETKAFVRSFKKYADLNRIEEILNDSNLEKTIGDSNQFAMNLIEESKKILDEEEIEIPFRRIKAIMFQFNGTSVNAAEILLRINQIDLLKNEKEIPKIKSVSSSWPSSIEWSYEDDQNLIKGILKYGLGNWDELKNDKDLNFNERISGKENEDGKINSSHLLKRIDDLCESIFKNKKKEKKKESKKTKISKNNDKSLRNEKPIPKISKNDKSKSTSSTNISSSSRSSSRSSSTNNSSPLKKLSTKELIKKSEEYLESISDIIKKLKELNENDDVDDMTRLKKTKNYLFIIGNEIDKIIENNKYENLESQLWELVYKKSNTQGNGEVLKKLYSKLKENEKSKSKSNSNPKSNSKPNSKPSPSLKKKRKQFTSDSEDEDDDYYEPPKKKK